MHYHDGRREMIEQADLVIDSLTRNNEGIAICQMKGKHGEILDEKYFFMTNDRKIDRDSIESIRRF